MDQVDYKDILYAIKTDNLVLFSNFIKDNEYLCFGRFPILSLCYLFNARKIIKKYKADLCLIKDYTIVDEDFEIYQKFRLVAGRALRLYVSGDMVSPVEMLAILHRDKRVRKLFKICKENGVITDKIMTNLRAIYLISSQKVYICDSEIKTTRKPLSQREKLPYKIGIIMSASFVLVLSLCLVFLNFSTGFGTDMNPYKIHNYNQLLRALSTSGSYVLTSDIILNDSVNNLEFAGVLDGNNFTISVESLPDLCLIANNKGHIKNLNIVYKDINEEISDSVSLFVGENNGTIENVSITCQQLNLQCNKSTDNDIYITGFAKTNNGTINNCDLMLKSIINTRSNGECYVSGLVGNNTAKVMNCSLLEKSSIDTNEADVSGICVSNSATGTIYKCVNHATISQDSDINEWSPNVAGVVLTNYGSIEECSNKGTLTATSTNETENAQGSVFLGGISALNYGSHLKCLNSGNLTATTKNIMVYCGGISAYSSYSVVENKMKLSKLDNCGALGNINVQTENEKAFAFAGGLCGLLYGEINDCFSLSTFTNDYNEQKNFFGMCTGASYIQYQFLTTVICIMASDNYMLSLSNVDYQIGALIYNNSIVAVGQDLSSGITTYLTEQQIKDTGVYWYE